MSEPGPNIPPLQPLDYASKNREYPYGSPLPSYLLGMAAGFLGSIFIILVIIGALANGVAYGTAFFLIAGLALIGVIFLAYRSKMRGAFIAGSISGFCLMLLVAGGVCFAILRNI
jgi:hypothetical protein